MSGLSPLAVHFDEIYVASTLRELQYRGLKVERGLTDDELHAVEAAIGAPLPPDLALFLHGGLLVGEDFPDWRTDPEGTARRARGWIERAVTGDIEVNQWWFDGWGPRPDTTVGAVQLALQNLSSAPPLVPIYSHRFMPTQPAGYGNPVLSVYQAVDSIYFGYDLPHYLHREFGVPRPPWSAGAPPRVPYWGEIFDLLGDGAMPTELPIHNQEGEAWYVALEIIGPYPPEAISAALNLQPARIQVDDEGAGGVDPDGSWRTAPMYTWAIESRLPILAGPADLAMNELGDHIEDIFRQVGASRLVLVEVSGWSGIDIVLSARLPRSDVTDDFGAEGDSPGPREASFELDPELMASLAQIRARLQVTFV